MLKSTPCKGSRRNSFVTHRQEMRGRYSCRLNCQPRQRARLTHSTLSRKSSALGKQCHAQTVFLHHIIQLCTATPAPRSIATHITAIWRTAACRTQPSTLKAVLQRLTLGHVDCGSQKSLMLICVVFLQLMLEDDKRAVLVSVEAPQYVC
jgi:hypothetical protein